VKPLSLTQIAPMIMLALSPTMAAEQDIKINQLQVLGSHNSYRPVPTAQQMAIYKAFSQAAADSLEYGHNSLEEQLKLGVRQFEFDPYADPEGGRYVDTIDKRTPAETALMARPGLKVLHTPKVDAASHCLTLALCFEVIAKWSRDNPNHELIFITVDTKEGKNGIPGIVQPLDYTGANLDEIDTTARAAFGAKRLITPDSVRGRFKTLREAVLARNWPSAKRARGKVMLILDSNPRIAALYRAGHPNLKGRALFGVYPEADGEASVFNIQDPIAEEERIKSLVMRGFIVRSRSDAGTAEARSQSLARHEAAVRAGAQIISTDYYVGAPQMLTQHFVVRMTDVYSQRNPVLDPQ
jgi:hypothetical protein